MLHIIEAIQTVSYNLYWIIGIFVSCTLVLHVLFILCKPLSLQRWKLSEYIWILLTFISVLGLVDESWRLNVKLQINQQENSVIIAKNSLFNWFDNYQEHSCIAERNDQQCHVISTSLMQLELLLSQPAEYDEIPLSLLDDLHSIDELVTPRVYRIIESRLRQYNNQRSHYAELVGSARRSFIRQLIVAMPPLLFVFG